MKKFICCLNCGEPIEMLRPCEKCSFVWNHAANKRNGILTWRTIFYRRHGGPIHRVPEGALLIVADTELR